MLPVGIAKLAANVAQGFYGGAVTAARPGHLLGRLTASASRAAAHYVPTHAHRMRNRRPIVSFTFDDVPDSAATNGAAILDRYGVKGTFYIAPGILGVADENWRVLDRDQLADLSRRGHEIGCHTFSHVKVQALSAAQLEEENRRTIAALSEICGPGNFRNFAYPYGVVSLPRKFDLQRQFTSCRSIYAGINAGVADLGMLRTHELYDRTLPRPRMDQLFDETARCNGWLILYTHDVTDAPSWIGCTPALMEHAVAEAKTRGFDCVPVHEALTLIGA